MNYIPIIVFVVVIVGLLAFSARARRRQAEARAVQAERIGVGTEVMTTSGLYGTVVTRNEDETVQLSIAPGVEVKWALAALKDLASLPDQYRDRAADEDEDEDAEPEPGVVLGKETAVEDPADPAS